MNRKEFIKSSLLISGLGPAISSCNSSSNTVIKGKIVGASAATGHMLRNPGKNLTAEPVETWHHKTVIVGGGISGLSAARHLRRNNERDFVLFDLESEVGGNAANGKNNVSAYPWGAHYVPVPNNNLQEYLIFLQDSGVITGFEDQLPIYNEYHLCFTPEERLYINGRWQEGLVPQYGVPDEQRAQIDRFMKAMDAFRWATGKDGKDAFAIPVNNSSHDAEFIQLDAITMKEWMQQNGYSSHYLHEYVNYCTRDDFGVTHDTCSAWAGIHYFAARKGRAVNADHSDVLTWPEGNGFLVNELSKNLDEHIKTGCLVTHIATSDDKVLIHFWDVKLGVMKAVEALQCIVAVPQFVAARLLKDDHRQKLVQKHFEYSPWMVANLNILTATERSGVPACWDNVIFESASLGYVEATHQLTRQHLSEKNITYYLPLTGGKPSEERKKAMDKTHADWVEIIMNDLQKVHPDIRAVTRQVDIMLWGHAMAQPTTEFIHGAARKELAASIFNKLHFAHTDIAGISIFEEGFYQGLHAAEKVLQSLKRVV